MLFFHFVCLFFCIVLLTAHSIPKSNSRNISELEIKLDNGVTIESCSADKLLNLLPYPTWKKQISEENDENIDATNKLDFSQIPKKHIKFKRITTKVMDLKGFERLENFGNQKFLHNSIKTYKVKEKESNAVNNLKQYTDSQLKPVSSFLEDKHFFYNDLSIPTIEPTRDDTDFAGTAEIEAILNEIKQREIQIIADQIPSVSNLITNTVTETTFASTPLISDSSIYPGFAFSTFLLVDNKSLINSYNNPQGSNWRNLKLHNIALRSVKDDTSTLAHDVENVLQNKIRKAYHEIKNKISKDFNKEIKKTNATVKEQLDKMNKKICPSKNLGSKNCSLPTATAIPIPKKQTKSILNEARNNRNNLSNKGKHKLTTLTTHTIPTVGDDLSMLSIVEQLLEKSEEDNAINMLTTKNNYSAKKDKEKLFKRNSLHKTLQLNNYNLFNNEEDVLDTEYTHSGNNVSNDTKDSNLETDATTEDTSYEGLSNKLSYNDYVNGYKYYLNFQRDKEDQKYSNQVRYQAHKHHSVDDIGKFILKKIPQLPTTRLRREFVDLETFDVQDLSTKSEDSWLKKHFFMFIDSNIPKKFHTSQTVALKPSGIQTKIFFLSNQTTKQTNSNKDFQTFTSRRFKKYIDEVEKTSTKTSLKDARYYEARSSKILRKLNKRFNLDNHYKQKSNCLSSINYRKNGFVDINLINKPTAVIKLNKKNKKTNHIRNIFHKIRFGHNKHNKKEKRQTQNRFNIFKGIRNIFKEKNEEEKELKGSKRHKIFDYEVLDTKFNAADSYEVPKYKEILKIDELRQQIPNISANVSVPHTLFSGSYINLTGLASVNPGQHNEKFIYNKKPELDEERRSVSVWAGSHYLKGNQQSYPYFNTNNQNNLRIDDIINVNIKTNANNVVSHEKVNTVAYPTLMVMTKNMINRNDVNDKRKRLLSFDENKQKQKTLSTNLRKGYKNQFLHSWNSYPKTKLSKEYQTDTLLINDVKSNNKVNLKEPTTNSGTTNRLSNKSPRNDMLLYFDNLNYSLSPIYNLRPLEDKKVQIDTKSNIHDIALKKKYFQPTSFVDPTMFTYRQNNNNLTMAHTKDDPTMFAFYEKTSNSLKTPERELVPGYNNYNVDINMKKTITKVNTPPEQYYSTPLPMQMDDFYKFLRSQNMDVESVTAPLFDSLPKRIDTWNLHKKNISKFYTKKDKMLKNNEHLKTFHNNLKAAGQSNKNRSRSNLIAAKKVQAEPWLDIQKSPIKSKDQNRKNIQEIGETPEYENSNYFLQNQKYVRNLRNKSNYMPHLNLGSMDLFQLDNSSKQPLVNSQKEEKDMEVTVIDLDAKKSKSTYKGQFNTNLYKIKKYHQFRTKSNLSNNNISRISFTEKYRDPLRFTHMYNEHILSKQLTNIPIYSYIYKKTTVSPTQPRRVQISGHSYKYDIIYHKPNYDWMSDLYEGYPTLITNSVVNYKNNPITVKKEKGNDHWYYHGDNCTVHQNYEPLTFAPRKIKKEIYNLDHSSSEYTPTQEENILLPKKDFVVGKIKGKKKFFFGSKDVKNIEDEPLIRLKSIRRKSQDKASNNNKNKFYKRDIQGQDSFTAKDVAALEVVVDLIKSTESFDEKGLRNTLLEMDGQKNIPYIVPSLKPEKHVTNAIQVHIALPSNINDKKRSQESIKVRKIFSAVMSSPVDLEYQIHSFEDNKVTKAAQDVISPGLYLLVENTNITVPKGNFALKPIRSNVGISDLILPKSSDTILPYDHVSNVTLSSGNIETVNNQLVKLYENVATINETKSKRFIKKKEKGKNKKKMKRNINWEYIKKYFGHDRVCHCRCKINETMCKPCAASDAVMMELIFEFDNLAKYMNDHCTEIQTFFWMNPTGGKKLKDTVHRLDTILYNYYKRVNGKCKGQTCKMMSSSIDKREYKINSSISQFLDDLESFADYLQKVLHQNIIYDANVLNAGKECINTINRCIDKNLNKRSYASYSDELNNKSIYSFNNIRVNLICNKDLTKHDNAYTRNTIPEVLFERNTNTPLYYDENEIKKDKKKGKGIKELLKKYSKKIKLKKIETPLKKDKKRHSVSYNQIEAPFLADSGGTFWNKYLYENMREPRQQKAIFKEINTKTTNYKNNKFLKRILTTTKITEKNKIANTSTLSKNDIQEKASETDDASLNVDTLNHNLNDLFKLLGNTGTIQSNKSKVSKLTILSKKQSRTEIHPSIKTGSKLTTTLKMKTTSRSSRKTTLIKHYLKLGNSKSSQHKKNEKELKTTKNVSTKTLTPKILHTPSTKISNSKVGFFNRIMSGSLKFLGNNENKDTILTETKSSKMQHRSPIEYVSKYRQKLSINTEKYSLKDNYNYGINDNENFTTIKEPTIIIIDNIGYSDKYTISIYSKNSTKSDLIKYHSPETVKRNIFKLLKEKKCGESPEDEMNDIDLNSLSNSVKFKNITQKVTHHNNCEYCDYDIIHSIRKSFGLTSSNLTTPSERKGVINKLFDKFSIKIIPNDKRIEQNEIKVKQSTISSKVVPNLNDVKSVNKSVIKDTSDTSIKPPATKRITAVANTILSKSNTELTKLITNKTSNIQSNSRGHNRVTKHLKEAGEDKLNQICDIPSTMAYVSKLQKSILKNNFEQYVKNIPCRKYYRIPQHFIIRSCIRKPSKTYSKRYRNSRNFDEVNKKRIHKWDWIRDKRYILEDETSVEDDTGKHFKEKKCLSGCSVPFILSNCVNVDKDNDNEKVNFHRNVKKNVKMTNDYNINKKNIKENFTTPKKYNIIHNIEFEKRNLLSFSNYLLSRRGYKKNSDLNGNFIQLRYGENDYYENFVRGKDGIYRKSLKRRKRLDADMSELNEGLLNLPPMDPFTDEIYVMVAYSISFDCNSTGTTKNRYEDFIWTTDRFGILDFDNVIIEGPKVFINEIKTNNFGNYLCSANNSIIRSIKIIVIDLPNIDIVFTPVYKTDICTYADLKSLQKLSDPISNFTCKSNCFVRIDEPICLKNIVDGSALLRPIIVMNVKRQKNINCSAECLRDLQYSLVILFAKNAPALASVKVLISYNGTKRILSPLRERKRSFVTHTLKEKDTNGHREYHRLAADMDPNSVNVVLLCSGGFYLVVGQKICAVCPPNTFSLEGENVCRNCPRGARSEPGARSCRLSMHLRRFNCPWKYVCGGAVCMLSCVIASCYAVSRLLRQPVSSTEIKTFRRTRKAPHMENHQKKTKSRPLSPSRVILSRLLRGSFSSSRATDSQETRFELWKEKNTLPPLPPIDFEL